ncbi:transglycosylase SLT domain-containing protein [Roseibium sp. Sym1]|uniref:transglycosylase SLT domain-containing protein n=1 Tax=Roseibium sp. Sym1 TaxID=3016006 RepID=UPI0022B4DE78|nr:transporter substrate-binding domain-containing protein [Roseibium sp. Sym1]
MQPRRRAISVHAVHLAFLLLAAGILVASGATVKAMGTGLEKVLEDKLRDPFDGDFDALIKRGYIRVLIPFSKTGYFIDKGVQRGSAVDLMTEFDKHLHKLHGKKVRDAKLVLIPTPRHRLFSDLSQGRGDIALGNLTITRDRQDLVSFSAPLLTQVHEVPVTSDTVDTISSPQALSGKSITVRKSASYFQSLKSLNETLKKAGKAPVEIVPADEQLEDDDLLEMVSAGAVETVIVDRHKADLWLQVLDGLKIHPDAAVRTDGEIAIAVRKAAPKLLEQVNGFAATVKKGTLLGNILFKRYLKEATYLKDMRKKDYQSALAHFRGIFQKYGTEYGVDWLLIAAQSFQESRFDPKARSNAGAVGLMQIKPATAAGSPINIDGIDADADKNVHAGVKYLRFLADHYFPGLKTKEANQAFFALAAYNAGPSRFERLREKARKHGYDPDKWFGNVEWIVASEIGRQPVDYVGNIYQYYLVFSNEHKHRQAVADGAAAGK